MAVSWGNADSGQNENKTLQDTEKENHAGWDEKYKQVLWQLQDYQEAKDHPQTQVVNIEMDELYATLPDATDSFLTRFRFKQRFKSMIDQYELRELHFHALLRSKELEVQYNIGRFDREKKQAEVEISRSRALNAQVLTFSKTETELRNQLNIYVEKFKQVRLDFRTSIRFFSLLFHSLYISCN